MKDRLACHELVERLDRLSMGRNDMLYIGYSVSFVPEGMTGNFDRGYSRRGLGLRNDLLRCASASLSR